MIPTRAHVHESVTSNVKDITLSMACGCQHVTTRTCIQSDQGTLQIGRTQGTGNCKRNIGTNN